MVTFEPVKSSAEPPEDAQRLLTHWRAFNAQKFHPTRSDFTPFSLKEWLGNIDIYDVENEGETFRMRLNGSEVVALTGEDWKGRTARDIDHQFGSTLHDELHRVFRTRQPLAHHIRIFQKQYMLAYRVVLPVFSDDKVGVVTQIFLAIFGLQT